MPTRKRYQQKVNRLRDVAATSLDKTLALDSRGPRTYLARQAVAKWLDIGGRVPVAQITWLRGFCQDDT